MKRGVLTLIGMAVGVGLVRMLILSPIEVAGWQMFWGALGEGGSPDLGMVLKSDTFLKCLGGAVVGGGLMIFLTRKKD